MSHMNTHPVADIFPRMSAASFEALKSDIAEHGLREPVWTNGGAIIDGRHRWQACSELGIPCPTREYEGADLVAFVVSLNLQRRHLDENQRAMVAANQGYTTVSVGVPVGELFSALKDATTITWGEA